MFKNRGRSLPARIPAQLPEPITQTLSDISPFGSICACFLPYKVTNISARESRTRCARTEQNIRRSFNLLWR
jgi:hypothetical protein